MNAAHSALLNDVRLYISQIGGLPVKVDVPGILFDANGNRVKLGTKGTADSLNCIKGRFVAVEVKTGSGKLSTIQRNFGRAVERAGGIFITARSVADVETRLRQEGLV